MFCTNCGARLLEGAKFCHACGSQTKASTQAQSPFEGISPNPNERPFTPIEHYYIPYAQPVVAIPRKEAKANPGLVLLSFLAPLLALFFYFNNKYYAPRSARIYGFSGLVALFLQVLFVIILIIINILGNAMFNMPL